VADAIRHTLPEPGDTLIATHARSQFSGECAVVTGRSSIFRVRVSEPGEVIQLDRDELLNLVQTDAELSEILLGAFLQRRLGLIAGSLGDAVVIGSTHDPGTPHVRQFLTRNGHPFRYVDLDRDADARKVLDRFGVGIPGIQS
jgi:thioredoxin reductase (NADPH)